MPKTTTDLPEAVRAALCDLSLIEALAIKELPGYYGNVGILAEDIGIEPSFLAAAAGRLEAAIKLALGENSSNKRAVAELSNEVIKWINRHTEKLEEAWWESRDKIAP